MAKPVSTITVNVLLHWLYPEDFPRYSHALPPFYSFHNYYTIPYSYWTLVCLAALSLYIAYKCNKSEFSSSFLQIPPWASVVSFPLPGRLEVYIRWNVCPLGTQKSDIGTNPNITFLYFQSTFYSSIFSNIVSLPNFILSSLFVCTNAGLLSKSNRKFNDLTIDGERLRSFITTAFSAFELSKMGLYYSKLSKYSKSKLFLEKIITLTLKLF